MKYNLAKTVIALIFIFIFIPAHCKESNTTEYLKNQLSAHIDNNRKLTQEINDSLFSFSELGFQEFETQAYLEKILRENDFKFVTGVSGIPSAWWATWGSGSPVIALGSDVDGIPRANQKPGVAYRDELVPGAPGHGEGHNAGQAMNITAALALKDLMERENIKGTIVLWPGIAEELLGSKAYFVRDGLFKDIDIVLFSHVFHNLAVSWGPGRSTGMISAEYTFSGSSAHSAEAPWKGRSALDGVELMNVGWNFRREHLRPLQRSHYVIANGGDQPNVVPDLASVWYYIREMNSENIQKNFIKLNNIAEGAALMTDTSVKHRIIGSAWPINFNKIVAETVDVNINKVGLPKWDKNDQLLAKAVQKLVSAKEIGLPNEAMGNVGPPDHPESGGSDDIGDISWNVPTATILFPSNIIGAPTHHWSSSIAMATPIAHKGATTGAKVMAMSALDFYLQPDKVKKAWEYFEAIQLKDIKYKSFISKKDRPAIEKNSEIMTKYKPELKKYYYNPDKYNTYLEQLGITYPTLKKKD